MIGKTVNKKRLAKWLVSGGLVLALGIPAFAIDLGSIIGVVGGGFLVSAVAEPLNKFINTITFNKGLENQSSTKVVPIVSIGDGTRIGAAQVSGPSGAVNRTKAVAQLETSFQDKLRVKVLIPIDSENPLQQFRRVQGVGVSAIIDLRL
ncbi:hypothetical protein TheveDRAFT_0516 [Thermanaerovibrio velox DSM 12556]|uniref:Uncharacterized protein n=1 Tax=Thermanaerovibrio velox DSM 12556 TaxID=926567 RepID=H0UQ48_9BACT|nr:hypothetical protein TheveDRAFT_0516 [Thermanaerovibrio velox DSM 12556]